MDENQDLKKNLVVPTWDEAVTGSKYVNFVEMELKTVIIQNWGLRNVMKEFDGVTSAKVEFYCDVINEDGKECVVSPKTITTVSNPFKAELKPILQELDPSKPIKISVLRIGTGRNTKYKVKVVI